MGKKKWYLKRGFSSFWLLAIILIFLLLESVFSEVKPVPYWCNFTKEDLYCYISTATHCVWRALSALCSTWSLQEYLSPEPIASPLPCQAQFLWEGKVVAWLSRDVRRAAKLHLPMEGALLPPLQRSAFCEIHVWRGMEIEKLVCWFVQT